MSSHTVGPGGRIISSARGIFIRIWGRKRRRAELVGRIGTGISRSSRCAGSPPRTLENIGRGDSRVEKDKARLWLAGGVYEDTNVIGAIRRHLRGESKRRIVAGNKSVIAPVVKKLQCVAGTVNQSN